MSIINSCKKTKAHAIIRYTKTKEILMLHKARAEIGKESIITLTEQIAALNKAYKPAAKVLEGMGRAKAINPKFKELISALQAEIATLEKDMDTISMLASVTGR